MQVFVWWIFHLPYQSLKWRIPAINHRITDFYRAILVSAFGVVGRGLKRTSQCKVLECTHSIRRFSWLVEFLLGAIQLTSSEAQLHFWHTFQLLIFTSLPSWTAPRKFIKIIKGAKLPTKTWHPSHHFCFSPSGWDRKFLNKMRNLLETREPLKIDFGKRQKWEVSPFQISLPRVWLKAITFTQVIFNVLQVFFDCNIFAIYFHFTASVGKEMPPRK